MAAYQLLSETYNEVIEAREYALYLIRLCLVRQMNIMEPPDVSQWEYKARQMKLTNDDCQKIEENNLYKCAPNETINAGTIYARNFLTAMQSSCKAIVQPSIDSMYYVYIVLWVILFLGVCLILKLLVYQVITCYLNTPTTTRTEPPLTTKMTTYSSRKHKIQLPLHSVITEEEETQCDCGGH